MNRKIIIQRRLGGIAAVSAALLMSTVAIGSAAAQSVTILHNFTGGRADGATPWAGLIRDSAGNLYGTTWGGGASSYGGNVFKLDTSGHNFTVLHSFSDGTVVNDGTQPMAGLTLDSGGNLYGTTSAGGSSGHGTVFKLDNSGHNYSVLHSFNDGTVANDGLAPYAGLIRDSAGNLYGTTTTGGSAGHGTVFKLSGPLTCLVAFSRR